MATRAQINSLITYYINAYKDKYNRAPNINRYKLKWGFEDMIVDLGMPKAKQVIDYYFTNSSTNDAAKMLSKYDEIHETMLHEEQDREHIAKLMAETKRRMHERGGTSTIKFGNQEQGHSPAHQQ